MLRVIVNKKLYNEDFIAVEPKNTSLLPSFHILTITAVLLFSSVSLIYDPISSFSFDNSKKEPLSNDSLNYLLTSKDNEVDVSLAEEQTENYEDVDLPDELLTQKEEIPIKISEPIVPKEKDTILKHVNLLDPNIAIDGLLDETLNANLNQGLLFKLKDSIKSYHDIKFLNYAITSFDINPILGKWFKYQIVKRDNLEKIFFNLNFSKENYDDAISAINSLKNTQINLQAGNNIYFLVDDNNSLLQLVIALNDKEQLRLHRNTIKNKFVTLIESLNNHVIDINSLNNIEDAHNLPLAKAKEKIDKAQRNKALRNNNDDNRALVILGHKLDGENFKEWAFRIGLTNTETNLIISKLDQKTLDNLPIGSVIRVLFDGVGTKALLNALEITTPTGQLYSFYRNKINNNYYKDIDEFKPTIGAFRRYPLSGDIQITSKFNPNRRHPVTKKYTPHRGLDLKAKIGTPVFAPADGVVKYKGYQQAAGYYIVLEHENNLKTVYMHLSKIEVEKGQSVLVGEMIARTGNSGRTSGPHLHYEIRQNNKPIDPTQVKLPSSSHPELIREQKMAFVNDIIEYRDMLYDNHNVKVNNS